MKKISLVMCAILTFILVVGCDGNIEKNREYLCTSDVDACKEGLYFETEEVNEYSYLSDIVDIIDIKLCEPGDVDCDTLFGKDLILTSDISLDLKAKIAMTKYANDNMKSLYIGQKIEEKEIIDIINSMFNDKVSNLDGISTQNSIMCQFIYEYNKTDKVFTIAESNQGCGGPTGQVKTYLSKTIKTDDEISLYVSVMNLMLDDDANYKAYSDYSASEQDYIGEYVYGEEHDLLNNKEFNYNDNDLQQYKFVFKVNNDKTLLSL